MELSFLKKDACIAIGLMSGTSADGIDAAVVELRGCGTDTKVRQLGFITLPFSDETRQKILQVAGGAQLDSREICLLNFYLGDLSADACLEACRAAGIQPSDVDFVGSHGQTIWHEPAGADYLGRKVRANVHTFLKRHVGPLAAQFKAQAALGIKGKGGALQYFAGGDAVVQLLTAQMVGVAAKTFGTIFQHFRLLFSCMVYTPGADRGPL